MYYHTFLTLDPDFPWVKGFFFESLHCIWKTGRTDFLMHEDEGKKINVFLIDAKNFDLIFRTSFFSGVFLSRDVAVDVYDV